MDVFRVSKARTFLKEASKNGFLKDVRVEIEESVSGIWTASENFLKTTTLCIENV